MPNLWVQPEELEGSGTSPYAYEACKFASYVLWAYSGRKYSGIRTTTERYDCPCRRTSIAYRHLTASGGVVIEPYLLDGEIVNGVFGGCDCPGTVGGRHARLRLRGRPIRSVQSVVSDGEVVSPDQYQVVNSAYLQAAPGGSFDPCGVEVTYTYGVQPPTAGRRAARKLAQEMEKALGGHECDLPDRVTEVTRQNVSYTILDTQDFLQELRTGIYVVDLFLKAVNPDKARKPARIFSPDMPRVSRVSSAAPTPLSPFDLGIIQNEAATWSVSLAQINANILLQSDWEPQAQVSAWNGATLLEFAPDRFAIVDGTLTVSLTSEETSKLTITGDASWDLYAVSTLDGMSVVHLLTSNVRLSEHGQTALI